MEIPPAVKDLIGDGVKILDDQKGNVTVSAWRRQCELAADRLAGLSGRTLLRWVFPSVRPNSGVHRELLDSTLRDLFKRSGKRLNAEWTVTDAEVGVEDGARAVVGRAAGARARATGRTARAREDVARGSSWCSWGRRRRGRRR